MNASYRLGLRIVLATVSAAAMLALLVPPPRPAPRAAHALETALPPLPEFRLTERSGRTVSSRDLAPNVWIAGFVFTRCGATCPKITAPPIIAVVNLDRAGARARLAHKMATGAHPC